MSAYIRCCHCYATAADRRLRQIEAVTGMWRVHLSVSLWNCFLTHRRISPEWIDYNISRKWSQLIFSWCHWERHRFKGQARSASDVHTHLANSSWSTDRIWTKEITHFLSLQWHGFKDEGHSSGVCISMSTVRLLSSYYYYY